MKNETTEDAGPDTEIEYWKTRFSNLNSVLEQLKKEEYKAVVSVLKATTSTTYKEWSAFDILLTDAINESKVCHFTLLSSVQVNRCC